MGFLDAFSGSLAILKDTLALTSGNPVLLKSTKYALAFGVAWLIGLAFTLGLSFVFPLFFLLFLLLLAVSFIAIPFIGNFFAAAHVWVVYKVARGEQPSFSEGLQRARHNFWDVLQLTVMDIIAGFFLGAIRRGRARGSGIGLSLLGLVLGKMLEEGYDLFRNFIIPAMVITDRDIWASIADLKGLKDRIAESLTGVLGFDFVGGIINRVIGIAAIVLIVLFFFIGPVGWLFIAFVVIVWIAASSAVSLLATFAKNTYFTLLWMELNEPKSLKKKQLAAYLERTKKKVGEAKK